MPMCAEILAIGPYCEAIRNSLAYPAEFYANTRDGVAVVNHLFGIVEGSTASREFAACLGITDPWDFNQHLIDPAKIDFDGLRALFGTFHEGPSYLRDLDHFVALFRHGFTFYFEPYG